MIGSRDNPAHLHGFTLEISFSFYNREVSFSEVLVREADGGNE